MVQAESRADHSSEKFNEQLFAGARVTWSTLAFQKEIPAKRVRYGYGTILNIEPGRYGEIATVQWDEHKHPKKYAIEFLKETFG